MSEATERPLLMIPGPIEVSSGVTRAGNGPPKSHLAPTILASYGRSLRHMRKVWCAQPTAQPFAITGSGTLAMEMAVTNLVDPGQPVLVINSGFFSDRMAEMLRRRGAVVREVGAEPGKAPDLREVESTLNTGIHAVFATHVDTSTGVRVDAAEICRLANQAGALSIFDGVCSVAAERFEMATWGADVVLTASQKAIGIPAGMALMVVSSRALAVRETLASAPPMSIDWYQWLDIMHAYEEGRRSYFSTPPTTLIPALDASLAEILTESMEACFQRHQRAADAMRHAWKKFGLTLLPDEEHAANTLSAIRFPDGIGAPLVGEIAKRGVVVAGGLHPQIKSEYFRVGHMGEVTRHPRQLVRTVRAVGSALAALGHAVDVEGVCAETADTLG